MNRAGSRPCLPTGREQEAVSRKQSAIVRMLLTAHGSRLTPCFWLLPVFAHAADLPVRQTDDLPMGFENLAATGIAGLILAVVVIPILRWMFSEMKAQREAFTSYLSTHATREEALMSALQQEIKREADILQKIYDAHLLDTNIGLQDTRQEIRRLREVIGQLSLYVPRNHAPRGEHEPHT
jgi:hypothetical protein